MTSIEPIEYAGPGGPFRGMMVRGDDPDEGVLRPGVLIAPTFMGASPLEVEKARGLVALGYTVLVADPYGGGKVAADRDEAGALMSELMADRRVVQGRMVAALDALRGIAGVDGNRLAAIGYCMGGKCVLDLARAGADLRAVVSLHGVFDPPPFPTLAITARVLLCQGWNDPLTPHKDKLAIGDELTAAGADWMMLALGAAGHGFTNPALGDGGDPKAGMAYNPAADRRSWGAMTAWLAEAFA